jgi:hypothetical protein
VKIRGFKIRIRLRDVGVKGNCWLSIVIRPLIWARFIREVAITGLIMIKVVYIWRRLFMFKVVGLTSSIIVIKVLVRLVIEVTPDLWSWFIGQDVFSLFIPIVITSIRGEIIRNFVGPSRHIIIVQIGFRGFVVVRPNSLSRLVFLIALTWLRIIEVACIGLDFFS